MYFSQNLKYLGAVKGINAAELARQLKISPQQVGRYLNGKNQPKFEMTIEIAELFNINLDDLLLKDLSKEAGRPFGAEGEDTADADETLARMNELLEQRLKMVEAALKRSDPEEARKLGIE
jgi:transcriptional regulator with XRE-family HTH domain